MAKIDKVLGSVSPLYGLASGQGAFAALSPAAMMLRKKKKKKQPGEKDEPGAMKNMRKGGKVKKMAKGGKVNHAGCGIAKRGLTRGRQIVMKGSK